MSSAIRGYFHHLACQNVSKVIAKIQFQCQQFFVRPYFLVKAVNKKCLILALTDLHRVMYDAGFWNLIIAVYPGYS